MKKSTIRENAGIAIIAAIIIAMAAIPQIGYIKIPFLAFDFTLLFVPVLIGTTIYGKKGGLILGLTFGLSSFFVALLRPTTPFDLTFRNPLVSVLPRVVFPLIYLTILNISNKLEGKLLSYLVTVTFAVITLIFFLTGVELVFTIFAIILTAIAIAFVVFAHKNPSRRLDFIIPTFISIVIHGLFVLSMIALLYHQTFVDSFGTTNIIYMLVLILVTNTFVEAILSSLILQLTLPAIARFKND